ncbi:MAG TPA: hypothetical protein VLG16_02470 [Candidatus Saccharimonadales bacterium]|nr:hypothetical protein [Candidatus Saccharimonadales bacterium]
MTDGSYGKEQFEAGLAALGPISSFSVGELGGTNTWPDPVLLSDALGRSAFVLLQQRADYDIDAALIKGNATRPVRYTADEHGIQVAADAHILSLQNPYSITAYFPEASDGRGDAAHYVAPETELNLLEASRCITEQEARDLIADTAIPLGGELFVSRPEAEASHYAYYSSRRMSPLSVERHALLGAPFVQTCVDLCTTEGVFDLLDPVSVARQDFLNRLAYTGPATIKGVQRDLPAYKLDANNTLLRLSGIASTHAAFAPEDKGFFTYSYTNRRAWGLTDLIGMIRAKENKQEGAPLPLMHGLSIREALDRGLIDSGTFVYSEVPATSIVYKALVDGPDTEYFQNLRRELGPAFNQEERLITQARIKAQKVWQAILMGQGSIEPIVTGLEEVATYTGMREQKGVTVEIGGGSFVVSGGGKIIIH